LLRSPTHLIVLNQTSNPAFDAWLQGVAREAGSVELWSGNRSAGLGPQVLVRPGPAYDRTTALSRLRSWLAFTVWAAWGLLWRRRVAVIVVTNPPFMVLAVWLLSRLRRLPYGLLEWDIYPHILRPMGLAGTRHPLYRLWHWLHRQALRRAAAVVTLGDEMAGTLRQISPEAAATVVPNWVDVAWLRPQPHAANPFVREHRLQDKFVILYSGNLGATHAIETIVAVAEALRHEAEFQFVMIGEGSKRGLVETAVASGRTPNILLLPYQPAANLPWSLSSAAVAVVTLGSGYEGLSMPSKTYQMMAAGNALLGISCPPNDLALTIERHQCGANFRPDEPSVIADWLRGLAVFPHERHCLQAAARQAAASYYSAEVCIPQLTDAFRPVWADVLHDERPFH
jgi:colanic acid biosynthesis glycosyl transferase WcaI